MLPNIAESVQRVEALRARIMATMTPAELAEYAASRELEPEPAANQPQLTPEPRSPLR